jgi:hydroxyquinol 1,2-dioxygenase
VLGPFWVADAPARDNGAVIARAQDGEPLQVSVRVLGPDGSAVEGAVVDVWQASAQGLYDVQDPAQPKGNLRGRFRSDADGRVELWTVRAVPHARIEVWEADDQGFYDVQYGDARVAARARLTADASGGYRFWALEPTPYPIPDDGPVGRMLRALGRHPWRAAHIHFRIWADGYEPLTTHLFDRASDYLDSDTVFGVKESLIRTLVRVEGAPPAELAAGATQHYRLTNDFVLTPAS